MNNTFTVNETSYKARPVTFNFMCDMEDKGISFSEFDTKPMKLCREYLAYCGDMSSDEAGEQIEAHVIAGGDMAGIYEALAEAINESDFFQAAIQGRKPKKAQRTKKPAED